MSTKMIGENLASTQLINPSLNNTQLQMQSSQLMNDSSNTSMNEHLVLPGYAFSSSGLTIGNIDANINSTNLSSSSSSSFLGRSN